MIVDWDNLTAGDLASLERSASATCAFELTSQTGKRGEIRRAHG